MLVWEDDDTLIGDLVQAVRCPLNPGIPDQHDPLETYIYVDDILALAVGKKNILRLLATIIEAIFTVYGCPMTKVCRCPLSLNKWEESVVGLVQTALGLAMNANKLTTVNTSEYREQVRDLLMSVWANSRRIFKVADMQKLIVKIARLGEGAPWIYKIMSHLYTSIVFALKQNKLLLLECSPKFRDILAKIERKQFGGNQYEIAKELNFTLKTAAKLVNSHKQIYTINETMKTELDFIRNALKDDSGIFLKYLLSSLSQGPRRYLCLVIALSFPVADTQLLFDFGGICHSQMNLFNKFCCILLTTRTRLSYP